MNVLELGLGKAPAAVVAAFVAMLVVTAAPARGALHVEENFGYSAATNLVGQGGWAQTGSTATNPLQVQAPGLTLAGYASTSGNAVALGASGQDANLAFLPTVFTGSVYYAFLVQVTSAQTPGDYFIHLCHTPASISGFYGKVWCRKDTASAAIAFGITKGSNVAADVLWTGYSYATGTTYLCVVKYTFHGGSNTDDVVDLWVAPAIGSPEPSPDLTRSDGAADPYAPLGTVNVRQGTASNAATLAVDGIRLGTTWDEVVNGAIAAPVALSATGVDDDRFTARWSGVVGATGYRLDVSTDSGFGSFVPGFDDLAVPDTSQAVTGLTVSTVYYYRVRAENTVGSSGNSNVVTVETLPAPLSGTYTVGVGRDYETLTAAVAELPFHGISGTVTFSLTDVSYPSETLPIVIRPFAGAGTAGWLVIKPAPGVSATISGDVAGGVLQLDGADYVYVDGSNTPYGATRDLTIRNTSTAGGTAAICVFSGPDSGATDNFITNVNVACGSDQSAAGAGETFGIISSGGAVSTTSDGPGNDRNTYRNNSITKTTWGIYLRGDPVRPDTGNVVSGNVVGPAGFGSDQIGRGGIVLEHQSDAQVSQNEVRYTGVAYLPPLQTAAATNVIGIGLGGRSWGAPTPTFVRGSRVTGNRVHDLAMDKAGGSAVGLLVAADGGGDGFLTSNMIANNMIWNVRSSGTNPHTTAGIGLYRCNSDRVIFNSVSLYGDLDPDPASTGTKYAAALRIGSTGVQNLILENNILAADVRTNSGGGRVTPIMLLEDLSWGMGGADYNDYFVPAANPEGYFAYAWYSTTGAYVWFSLADWRNHFYIGQDAHSVSGDPRFVSAGGDPHVSAAGCAVSAAANAASFRLDVVDDFDSQGRHAATPDIGADEFTPALSTDLCAGAFVDPPSGATRSAGVPFYPSVAFFNPGFADQAGAVLRYRILDPGSGAVFHEVSIGAASIRAESGYTPTFFPVTLWAGTYTLEASVALPGDMNPANDIITGTLTVIPALSGTYTVGAGQDYPTLTAAVAALNGAGVSGAVTFLLTDPSYGEATGESFPIEIRHFEGASEANRITLRPAPGVNAEISGSCAWGLLRLLAADYVTVDGSNTAGGTGRNLTFTNGGTSVAVVTMEAPSAGDGATHNVVRNCVIRGAGSTTRYGVFLGRILTGSEPPEEPAMTRKARPARVVRDGPAAPLSAFPTSAQAPNSYNRIENNAFGASQYAIYLYGYAWHNGSSWVAGDVGNEVVGNLMGAAAAQTTGGAYVAFQQDLRLSDNDVQNVAPTATAYGLYVFDCAGASITRNRVHGISCGPNYGVYGVYVITLNVAASGNLFANNRVYDLHGSSALNGIYLYASRGDRYLFNSVYLTGSLVTTSSGVAACFRSYQDLVSEVRDNVFAIEGSAPSGATVYVRCHELTTGGLVGASDHNDYFLGPVAPALAFMGRFGFSVYCSGLAEWQSATGADAHSLDDHPWLVGPTDLHVINSGSVVSPLADAGSPDSAVTADCDGEMRSLTAPDIGADEFVTHALTVHAVHGSVTKVPNLPLYNPGYPVELTAVPDPGYHFAGWSGDTTSSENPLTLLMGRDYELTANFAADAFLLTLGTSGHGTITKAPDQPSYPPGTSVLVTAVPAGGWAFQGWSGDTTGADNPITVWMYRDRSFTASFGDTAKPLVAVVAPNGGLTQLLIGTPATLLWTATDNWGIATVDLLLSRTGPAGGYETLAAAIANSGSYEWTVTGPASLEAFFKVVARDSAGNAASDVSDAASDIAQPGGADGGPVTAFALSPVWPNPVLGAGRIVFSVPREARVKLAILDLQGREVAVLAHGVHGPGRHTALWSAGAAHAGVFFARFETPDGAFTRRFVLGR